MRRREPDHRREQLPQDARRQHTQRIDRNIRIVGRPAQVVICGEHALRTADQQLAEERDIAEQRVQCIGGRDGAGEIQTVALGVDPAAGSDAERLAESLQVLDRHPAAAQREIATQCAEGQPVAGQHAENAGE